MPEGCGGDVNNKGGVADGAIQHLLMTNPARKMQSEGVEM